MIMRGGTLRVAVVGAGISGLSCARTLANLGLTVTVFEKSRGVGGRTATRRRDDDLTFDHGAQYFTVYDERFGRHVRSWQQEGLVDTWAGRIRVLREGRVGRCNTETQRLVGTPGMNAVCKHLAAGIDVRLRCEIVSLEREGGSWRLVEVQGEEYDAFDVVVVSAPGPQAARLLGPVAKLADLAAQVTMRPCWAVMLVFEVPLPLAFDGAFVQDSSLSWVARNSSKPGRSRSGDCWVLHGSACWSEGHVEAAAEEVAHSLLDDFWRVTDMQPVPPRSLTAHRWRYAQPQEPLPERCLFDAASGLGACGDWCSGPRVEGAFLSGLAAADAILGTARRVPP